MSLTQRQQEVASLVAIASAGFLAAGILWGIRSDVHEMQSAQQTLIFDICSHTDLAQLRSWRSCNAITPVVSPTGLSAQEPPR